MQLIDNNHDDNKKFKKKKQRSSVCVNGAEHRIAQHFTAQRGNLTNIDVLSFSWNLENFVLKSFNTCIINAASSAPA